MGKREVTLSSGWIKLINGYNDKEKCWGKVRGADFILLKVILVKTIKNREIYKLITMLSFFMKDYLIFCYYKQQELKRKRV